MMLLLLLLLLLFNVSADLCKDAAAAHEKCYMSVINTGEGVAPRDGGGVQAGSEH